MRAMSLLGSMIVLAVLSSPVTAAQQQRPSQPQSAATAGTDKKACDFLSKEEAESILSQPVELKADYPKQCQYVEVGFTNKPPKNKLVSIGASTSSTPQPNEYVEAKKNAASFQEVKEVSDVGDAAVWLWIPGFGGSLYAYKAGTITVAVIVNGLPEDTALQHAKTLAAKLLGGLAGTGYVYAGTPKHRAAAAADASVERSTVWYVNAWAAKDKASADAEFAKILHTPSAVEKRPLTGITAAPELDLTSAEDHDFCTKPDSSWRDLWTRAFQRVDLAPPTSPPTLRLHHFMNCHFNSGSTPVHYFWYYDRISLVEDNLVFEFNGGLVRRPGELLSGSHSTDSLEEDTKPPTEDFLPRSINDFAVDLSSR